MLILAQNPGNANAKESMSGVPEGAGTNVNIYGGRGILIQSQGPTWFWASAAEHSELYNYQLLNASTLFMSHMQTESPYYQPEPSIGHFAYAPNSGGFSNDPTFADCTQPNCLSAWALRVMDSQDILLYTTGFYSFFDNQILGCGSSQNCQERLIETNYTGELFYYNIFT